ncbi:MAG: DUF2840 domain-containing protein [Steroidobacteraceae bacterium]
MASRIDILRATPPGAPISTVPGVAPGGEILLRCRFAQICGLGAENE